MSMFDWYKFTENPRCPKCGTELKEWQGKDGPCALFVWEQGKSNPISQEIEDDEIRWSDEDLQRFFLPDSFTIYSYDCEKHQPIIAECKCIDGVWLDFKFIQPE